MVSLLGPWFISFNSYRKNNHYSHRLFVLFLRWGTSLNPQRFKYCFNPSLFNICQVKDYISIQGDDFAHRANFYLGELQAGYLDVNTMIAAQQTSNGVLGDNGITVSDDLAYRQATDEELEKIGFQGPGKLLTKL